MHVFLAPEHAPAGPVVVHLLPGVASRSLLGFAQANRLGRVRVVDMPARARLEGWVAGASSGGASAGVASPP